MTALRLQKLLASAGVASRRGAETLIRAGRVRVDGEVASLGQRVDPQVQQVEVDGKRLRPVRYAYWLANKTRGVLTTRRDPQGRPTLVERVPKEAAGLAPVGRLDRDTEGLVLLTNDGDTAHALLHPSLENEREYRVTVRGHVSDEDFRRLERGLPLRDGRTAAAAVSAVQRAREPRPTTSFALTLREGRKRQIRRSMAFLGHPVVRLVRVRMGPLRLGRLPTGAARPLRGEERRRLLDHVRRLRLRRRARQARVGEPESGPPSSESFSRIIQKRLKYKEVFN